MKRFSEGSAHPHTVSSSVGDDLFTQALLEGSDLLGVRAQRSTEQPTPTAVSRDSAARTLIDAATLRALEHAIYHGPWVLIEADNTSPARAKTLISARAAVADGRARTYAGRVRDGVLVADIDPAPGHPIDGDVCAESLVAWCVKNHVPYLVRESGRPGGRHVLAVAHSADHAANWRALCARLTRHDRVRVEDRTGKTLRLLTAPHRHGLYCPVIASTLTPDAVHAAAPRLPFRGPTVARGGASSATAAPARDRSRSGREYGLACAMARAGYTVEQAWHRADAPGAKSARGQKWWRRYIWLPAVTTVAAENGFSEGDAWALARRACPAHFARISRRWWRGLWQRALAEAAIDRPRRRRLDSSYLGFDLDNEVAILRRALTNAAIRELSARRARPQRRHSVTAMLHALAPVLVTRNGSISIRALAEQACLDTKTVRSALRDSVACGLLIVTHRYERGLNDCNAYAVGPAAQEDTLAARAQTSPTCCSTPLVAGQADPQQLRERHRRDRRDRYQRPTTPAWSPTAPADDTPALRSLHFQRTWWERLAPAERAHRRAARRRLLRQLDDSDRSAWFRWLEQRETLTAAAARVVAGTPGRHDTAVLADAPSTVHRGMRDPAWRDPTAPVVRPRPVLNSYAATPQISSGARRADRYRTHSVIDGFTPMSEFTQRRNILPDARSAGLFAIRSEARIEIPDERVFGGEEGNRDNG